MKLLNIDERSDVISILASANLGYYSYDDHKTPAGNKG